MKNLKSPKLRILAMLLVWSLAFMPCLGQSNAGKKTSGYAPINGLKIYYEVHGSGQPLLLLHGAYMTIDLQFSELIPALAKNRKVIVFEMQGHGRTADTDRPFSYDALASDAAGLLKYLKIDRADVLGYSMGGTVAFQLAIKYPELVNKLVIMSTVYKYTGWMSEVREILKTFQPEFFDNTPLKTAYDSIAPDPAHWHAFVRKFIEFDTKDFDLGDANIQKIQSPVLFIMGDNDGVDLNHKVAMYTLCGGGVFGDMAGLPKSQLAIVPGTTHVSLMMQTASLASMIQPFLEGTPPVGQH